MFDQAEFGAQLRTFRRQRGMTQRHMAEKIGVSVQALSKWENGICLPDVYHLKLLARVLKVTADCLLEASNESGEKVVETIRVGGAAFEVVEKSAAILAGKILYARDFKDYSAFDAAIGAVSAIDEQRVYMSLAAPVLPVSDIHLSVNFWRSVEQRAYGFVREVLTDHQPEGVDVFHLPASLYIRAHTDSAVAQMLAKERCEVWELFAYIRDYFMPSHGFRMAENGAQELEVFDTPAHTTGYAYMPVVK